MGKYMGHTIKNTAGMFINCRDTVEQIHKGLDEVKDKEPEEKVFMVDGMVTKVVSDDILPVQSKEKNPTNERITILEIQYV